MHRIDLVPKCPNDEKCFSLGCYSGNILMAYGSGKRVCILLANTLIIQQLTEEFESEISSIAWARTGGRISVGMNGSIIILVPTDLL